MPLSIQMLCSISKLTLRMIILYSLIFSEHFNVLYRENWTAAASKVIRKFELDVIKKAKNEGYDGQDIDGTDVTSQWDFSGALLYSVTVITTIGECYFEIIQKC